MVEVTLDNLVPSTPPTDGWRVEYRIKGTTGAYITPVGSPFSSFPIVFTTTDPGGTLYEGHVWRDCGTLESTKFNWVTPCDCTNAGVGYTVSGDGTFCEKTDTIAATVTSSGFCLAATGFGVYSQYGSRIYKPGFTAATLFLAPGTVNTYIEYNMSISPQWANTTNSIVQGPMNRRAVWIDSDCDGNKDSLSSGVQTTIAFMYDNTGPAKTIYIGIAADNKFKLVVNGNIIVDTTTVDPTGVNDMEFKMWHIIPVTMVNGLNYFNAVATGDGTINDAMAMCGYNNTSLQIKNATTDSALTIIFDSVNLRGEDYDVATCPPNYSLDTSEGSGNYVCVRKFTSICNPIEP